MFTGIIQDVGSVIDSIHSSAQGITLVICTALPAERFDLGASVSCNGACLTVIAKHSVPATGETLLTFQAGPTTLELTELGNLVRGSLVNIEPSLRVGDDLGGHEVSGHVDCKAEVKLFEKLDEEFWKLRLQIPGQFRKFLSQKGSIAVRGTSLTIAHISEDVCAEIMLIPHTVSNTNFKGLKVGQMVEIEFDKFTKAVVENIERILPNYLAQLNK